MATDNHCMARTRGEDAAEREMKLGSLVVTVDHDDPPREPNEPTTFHTFTDLPYEIRSEIWNLALSRAQVVSFQPAEKETPAVEYLVRNHYASAGETRLSEERPERVALSCREAAREWRRLYPTIAVPIDDYRVIRMRIRLDCTVLFLGSGNAALDRIRLLGKLLQNDDATPLHVAICVHDHFTEYQACELLHSSRARFTTVQFILDFPEEEMVPCLHATAVCDTENPRALLIRKLAGTLDGTDELVGRGLLTTYLQPFRNALRRPAGSFGLAERSRFDENPSFADVQHRPSILPLVRLHYPAIREWVD